jgi:hypothetical protein
MHESPQHAAPAPAVRHESHLNLLTAPGAQAVVSDVTTGPAKSRAPGIPVIRNAALENGGTVYVSIDGPRVCVNLTTAGHSTFWHLTVQDARNLRDLLYIPECYAPTTTDGESHLTDESVIAECAESQERAHAQLYGGAR